MSESRLDYTKIQMPKKELKTGSRKGTDSRSSSPDREIIMVLLNLLLLLYFSNLS